MANKSVSSLSSPFNEPNMIEVDSDPYLKLQREIDQIKKRQKEFKILIQCEKIERENVNVNFDDIDEKLGNLADEHMKIVEARAVQDVIIPSVQLSDTLYKVLQSSSSTGNSQKKLNEYLAQIAVLSNEALELRKELSKLEENILELQLNTQHISAEKLELMKKLQEHNEQNEVKASQPIKGPTLRIEQLRKEERKLTRMLNIKNHILQKIVAFSGLNWAQDDELKSIVLDTGKPLELQLSELTSLKD